MLFQSIRLKFVAIVASALVCACGGGSSAPPPAGGITVVPGDGQVTVSWTPDTNVQYWLFYAAAASISTASLTTLPNHVDILNVTSPFVVSGLTNGVTYSFTLDGRYDGGPGGSGTPSVSAVPRLAGANWAAGTSGSLGISDMHGLAFGTATDALLHYVAVGNGGAMYQGLDGVGWTAISHTYTADLNAVMYAMSKFVAVGAAGTILYSTDLATWTAASSSTTRTLNGLASNGARVVAVGDGGTIMTSTDGIIWTAATSVPTSANLNGVALTGSGVWLAVGSGGTLLTSADGLTWTALNSGTGQDLRGVASMVSYVASSALYSYSYVAVGDGGTILTSVDATTWTRQIVSPGNNLQAVVAKTGQWVAVGAGAWHSPVWMVLCGRNRTRQPRTISSV